VVKSDGNRLLTRPRRNCVDNINMDLREIVWDDLDCIDMAQGSYHWRALVNLRVP
jgi:hypothetical protein